MSRICHRMLGRTRHKHRKDNAWTHISLGSWRPNYPIWLQLPSIRTKRRLRDISGRAMTEIGG